MTKAIIFDMDGVLVDTEPLHQQAYREAMGEEVWGKIDFSAFIGMGDKESCDILVSNHPMGMSAQDLKEEKDRRYKKLLLEGVTPIKGAMDVVRAAKARGRTTAIASSSMRAEIEIVVKTLHAQGLFDALAGGDEVEHAKPAPDVFLLAAKRLGVSPEECLVIEDSPSGVKAAKAAGMKVIAVPSRETEGKDFSEADRIEKSITDAATFF